jgi:hypothetical protein
MKNSVLTLSKGTHLGGTVSNIIPYTHETEYLEIGGKRFSKVTIAEIIFYGGCCGCEERGGRPGALPMAEQERRLFPCNFLLD